MGVKTQGRRVAPRTDGTLWLEEGDYGLDSRGHWMARPPGNHSGDLSQHTVEEHDDGTITVTPSILINDGRNQWHGHLIRGVWEDC